MRSIGVCAAAAGLIMAAGCNVATAESVTVQTVEGPVAGNLGGNLTSFLGIPYAAPPVGDLRFRAPAPHAPWAEPLQANTYGSPCPQSARLGSPSTNEDCLFLNVWAPPQGSGHPVLVFIHGGSFNAGSGGAVAGGPDYSGADIAAKSGAVVVTINYRLGILGFLAAAALDAETAGHVSGNYGLLDQQAALGWVHRNIAAFGGDAGNVTLFGESAGGISILYQLVSPGAAGLFQHAIVESANDGTTLPLGVAETVETPILKALGCDAADTGCLRRVPVEDIIKSGLNAGPPVDGHTVPRQPVAALADGHFQHVPVIVGTNATEGTYFLAVAARSVQRPLTQADYEAIIRTNYPGAAVKRIEAAYPIDGYSSPGQALAAIETDSFFACPSDAVRLALAEQVPVFGYEFTQAAPVHNFPLPEPFGIGLGQAHTTELAYVFGHDGDGAPLRGGDLALSDRMIGYWGSLAAGGNPNGAEAAADGVSWPRYRPGEARILSLGTPVEAGAGFAQSHHCALWQSLGYPQKLLLSVPKT